MWISSFYFGVYGLFPFPAVDYGCGYGRQDVYFVDKNHFDFYCCS